MKKKLLLIAYRAWGDFLYTVPSLTILNREYDIYLETNWKIWNLVHNDPRFKHVSTFIYEKYPKEQWANLFVKRWKAVEDEIKPDKVINLNGSLEVHCIAENFQEEFYLPHKERREHFGQRSFYDAVFERCGIEPPNEPKLDELYYSPEEIKSVEDWRKREKNSFIIIMPIAGSTSQKVLHPFLEWTDKLLKRYPKAKIYLSGDNKCKLVVPKKHPRVKNLCGSDIPIKQNFLMTKYANYVIGPETGTLVAAGMWGTPKTMLCTTSNVYQCVKYHKNDHSIQAPIYCSPCHRAIYFDTDCEQMMGNVATKSLYPACAKSFNLEYILPHIDMYYNRFSARGNFGPHLPRKYPCP